VVPGSNSRRRSAETSHGKTAPKDPLGATRIPGYDGQAPRVASPPGWPRKILSGLRSSERSPACQQRSARWQHESDRRTRSRSASAAVRASARVRMPRVSTPGRDLVQLRCPDSLHFSQVCRPDQANPMPAGTSVAISDVVGSQAVIISRAGLRCSGNDLRPAFRLTVRNPGSQSYQGHPP